MADDFDITACIGGVDENEMISKMEPHSNFVHLSQEPLAVVQKTFQSYVWEWNIGGRPIGLWITPSSEWLINRQQRNLTACCYLYDIKADMSRIITINNEKDFKQFDKKYRNYWINLDYQYIKDFKWYPSGNTISVEGDYGKIGEIWNNMTWLNDAETVYDALIRLKIIFDSPEAAKEGCEAYRKHPAWIKIFKYKDWNHVASEYSGIVINNWAKNKEGLKYFWYQSLSITSGCIWDPRGIIDIIPTMIKKTPTSWMGAADGTVRRMSNFSSTANNIITGGIERKDSIAINTAVVNTASDTAVRDETIKSLIPNKISECAIHLGKKPGDTCASDIMLAKLSTVVGQGNPEEIIARAKQITKTSTERDAIIALQGKLGHEFVAAETISVHKIAGPTSAALLSNTNIDTLLKQWTIAFPDFFAYNFNMLDYARNSFRDGAVIPSPDTLATISVADLYRIGHFRRAACVINSDVYTGEGKHWMVLYVDMSVGSGSGGDSEGSATVEFFNSSGNAPAPEWINWLEKSRSQLEDIGIKCEIIRVSTLRHQDSKSECGVYSLFYIWARLHGVPYSYFSKKIPDKIMFEFRQHIFTDPRRPALKEFNWDEYRRGTKIAWE
mgnify:FL=1